MSHVRPCIVFAFSCSYSFLLMCNELAGRERILIHVWAHTHTHTYTSLLLFFPMACLVSFRVNLLSMYVCLVTFQYIIPGPLDCCAMTMTSAYNCTVSDEWLKR